MSITIPSILPAISDFKRLKYFLKTDFPVCILMDFQLAELEDIVNELKRNNKKVFIHIDLIKGLSSDEFGAIYLAQKLHVDGIISIKPSVIMLAKKRNIIAIQRVFLKDTLSLNRSISLANKTEPDYLEILPAMANTILTRIIEETNSKIICGGLISSKKDINDCLNQGAVSVTTSNPNLWK